MKRECLTIIGTAHVSSESVDEVKDAIYEQHPEVVAIELDRGRYIRLKKSMMNMISKFTQKKIKAKTI